MQQIDGDLFTYSVAAHETITIAVTPMGVGNFASVNIDGAAQPRAFSYSLTSSDSSGTEHVVMMEFEFPGIKDPDARYDVALTSANGDGPFKFSVKNSNTLKEATLSFTVN